VIKNIKDAMADGFSCAELYKVVPSIVSLTQRGAIARLSHARLAFLSCLAICTSLCLLFALLTSRS